MEFRRTDADNADFRALVRSLDSYLAEKDGDEHTFYDQYNQLDAIRHVIVGYEEDRPVVCGAIKPFSSEAMEVKRMFTVPAARQKGYASLILRELETWSKELGYRKCILETGNRQQEAIRLYEKNRYERIPNYGQYEGVQNSICFEKNLA